MIKNQEHTIMKMFLGMWVYEWQCTWEVVGGGVVRGCLHIVFSRLINCRTTVIIHNITEITCRKVNVSNFLVAKYVNISNCNTIIINLISGTQSVSFSNIFINFNN